jgi:hypothetical protein
MQALSDLLFDQGDLEKMIGAQTQTSLTDSYTLTCIAYPICDYDNGYD